MTASCERHASFRRSCEDCQEEAVRAGFVRPGAVRAKLLEHAQDRVNGVIFALVSMYVRAEQRAYIDGEDPTVIFVDLPSGGRLRGTATVKFRWETER